MVSPAEDALVSLNMFTDALDIVVLVQVKHFKTVTSSACNEEKQLLPAVRGLITGSEAFAVA
jgi:hypothetical protein